MFEKSRETLVIRNQLTDLARVEHWLAAIAEKWGIPTETAFAVELVINEAVTNIVSYAYSDKETHEIALALTNTVQAVIIEIDDDGTAFDPFAAPGMAAAANLDEAAIGGRGIHLIKSFSDHHSYTRVGGHNRMTLAVHKASRP
jgi:anti-sigma regulatory factor (Ser/Thr protein kinase)